MLSGWLLRRRVGAEPEPELRGDDDLVTDRVEGLTDEGLVGERPVRLGGVEECHPQIVGAPDQAACRGRCRPGSP